jgi:hypothetical protein
MSSSWPLSFACGSWSVAFVFPCMKVCAVGLFCFRVEPFCFRVEPLFVPVGPCCFRVELLFGAVGPFCFRMELLFGAVGPFCFRVELLFVDVVGDVDVHVACLVCMWPLYWSVSSSSSWFINAAVVEEIESFWLVKSFVVDGIESFVCCVRTIVGIGVWTCELRSLLFVWGIVALRCRGSCLLRGRVSSALIVVLGRVFVRPLLFVFAVRVLRCLRWYSRSVWRISSCGTHCSTQRMFLLSCSRSSVLYRLSNRLIDTVAVTPRWD